MSTEKNRDNKQFKDPSTFFIPIWLILGLCIVFLCNWALCKSGNSHFVVQSFFVFILGLLAAYVELSSRYSDSPSVLWRIPATQIYLTINALLSFFALVLIKTFELSLEVDVAHPEYAQSIVDVVTAVFSSQIIFRSSLFVLKDENNENKTIGGLSGFVTDLLELIDSHVDKHIARQRSSEIHKIIPSAASASDLVNVVLPYLEQLLQNSDQKAFHSGARIAKLYEASDKEAQSESLRVLGEVSNHAECIKPILIGLELYNLVGSATLKVAMTQLERNNLLGTNIHATTDEELSAAFANLGSNNKPKEPKEPKGSG